MEAKVLFPDADKSALDSSPRKKTRASGFSCNDACAIIDVCAKNNVSTFLFRDLSIEFHPKASQAEDRPSQGLPTQTTNSEEERISSKKERLSLAEDELDLLRIEDPATYEEFMMKDDESES
jgi:hypothetical protein